jgi:hypothetical protein
MQKLLSAALAVTLLLAAPCPAQDIGPPPAGGTSSISVGNTLTKSGGVLNTQNLINAVATATSYPIAQSDMGKTVTHNSPSAVAVTLAQAGTTGFTQGTSYSEANLGPGPVTITPTTSTINGKTSLVLTQGQSAYIISDGVNYTAFLGKSGNTTQSVSPVNSGISANAGSGNIVYATLSHGSSLAKDGFATGTTVVSNSLTAALTTSSGNDVIIVYAFNDSGGAGATSITDGAGLTWHLRKQQFYNTGNTAVAEEWYAVSPGALAADNITVTYTAATSARTVIFGVGGANTTTIFDPNVSLPASNTTTGAASLAVTISTSNAKDILLAGGRCITGCGSITLPSGFTGVGSTGSVTTVGTDVVSSLQASVSESFGYTSGTASGIIVDAIISAGTTSISNPTNALDGQPLTYALAQDSTGNDLVSWGGAFDFGSSGAPTLSTAANKVDYINFLYNANLTKWVYSGSYLGN